MLLLVSNESIFIAGATGLPPELDADQSPSSKLRCELGPDVTKLIAHTGAYCSYHCTPPWRWPGRARGAADCEAGPHCQR